MQILTPYRTDKDLGRAYNEAMANVKDYAIIKDMDAMFLHPQQPKVIDEYVQAYPDAALFTVYGSRVHPASTSFYRKNNEGDFMEAMQTAHRLIELPKQVKRVRRNLTGFFMVVKKSTWERYPFKEGIGCLGVDTDYWKRLLAANEKVLLMQTVYVWHTYRLMNGIHDKTHLLCQ